MGNYKLYFVLVLFVSILSSESWGASAKPAQLCSTFLQALKKKNTSSEPTESKYGRLNPSFNHDTKYTVLEEDVSPIKNQCAKETCHLAAWTSMLERGYKQRTGENINLSLSYLSTMYGFIRGAFALLDPTEGGYVPVEYGAELYPSLSFIKFIGLMPEEAWDKSYHLVTDNWAPRIDQYLNNIIARAREDIRSKKLSKGEAMAKVQREIIDLYQNTVGKIPEKFKFKGKTYTPTEFAEKYFPEINKPLIEVTVDTKKNAETTVSNFNHQYYLITTSVSEIERLAKEHLDAGHSIYLTYDHVDEFVNESKGVMSISAFNVPEAGKPVDRGVRKKAGVYMSNAHVVQLIGYELDAETGRVKKWKLKNSWGKYSGDQGYYHMYADYFDAFMIEIGFQSTDNIKLPKIEKVLKRQPRFTASELLAPDKRWKPPKP